MSLAFGLYPFRVSVDGRTACPSASFSIVCFVLGRPSDVWMVVRDPLSGSRRLPVADIYVGMDVVSTGSGLHSSVAECSKTWCPIDPNLVSNVLRRLMLSYSSTLINGVPFDVTRCTMACALGRMAIAIEPFGTHGASEWFGRSDRPVRGRLGGASLRLASMKPALRLGRRNSFPMGHALAPSLCKRYALREVVRDPLPDLPRPEELGVAFS